MISSKSNDNPLVTKPQQHVELALPPKSPAVSRVDHPQVLWSKMSHHPSPRHPSNLAAPPSTPSWTVGDATTRGPAACPRSATLSLPSAYVCARARKVIAEYLPSDQKGERVRFIQMAREDRDASGENPPNRAVAICSGIATATSVKPATRSRERSAIRSERAEHRPMMICVYKT